MKDLDELYKIAKEHKETHKGCGAEPLKYYNKLFEIVERARPDTILELGTGIGFTAIVMHLAHRYALIDTVETHSEHVTMAKSWFKKFNNINQIQADVYRILPFFENNSYEMIFFDVYGPKEKFLAEFERILKKGGLLVSTNSHLKSAEESYFKLLENRNVWELQDKFEDTVVYRKI